MLWCIYSSTRYIWWRSWAFAASLEIYGIELWTDVTTTFLVSLIPVPSLLSIFSLYEKKKKKKKICCSLSVCIKFQLRIFFFFGLKKFMGFSLVIVIMTFMAEKKLISFHFQLQNEWTYVGLFVLIMYNFWKFGLGFDIWEVGFSSEIFAGSEIGVGDAASDIRWHSLSVWWRFDRKDKTRAMVC